MSDTDVKPSAVADGEPAPESEDISYKARYEGASKKINQLQTKLASSQKTYDDAVAKYESDLHDGVARSKQTEAELAKLQADLKVMQDQSTLFQSQIKKYETKENQRKLVAEKHPGLLPYVDDLKSRSEFDTDEAYDGYLTRMRKVLNVASPEYIVGSTPSAPPKPPATPGSPRSEAEISADLWNISDQFSPDPKVQAQLNALYAELAAARQARK